MRGAASTGSMSSLHGSLPRIGSTSDARRLLATRTSRLRRFVQAGLGLSLGAWLLLLCSSLLRSLGGGGAAGTGESARQAAALLRAPGGVLNCSGGAWPLDGYFLQPRGPYHPASLRVPGAPALPAVWSVGTRGCAALGAPCG